MCLGGNNGKVPKIITGNVCSLATGSLATMGANIPVAYQPWELTNR
jgi:hypothetical protein